MKKIIVILSISVATLLADNVVKYDIRGDNSGVVKYDIRGDNSGVVKYDIREQK